jgi:hypothetical protein
MINRLLHIDHSSGLKDAIPYLILLIPTYYIAINLKRSHIIVLISLIIIESIIVILEFYLGVSTFFTGLAGYEVFDQAELLYFRRPLGLSENSSDIASKLLIAITLIEFMKFKNFYFKIGKISLIFALILTFNRSAMAALFTLYLIIFILYLIKKAKTYKLLLFKIFILSVIFISIYFIVDKYGYDIWMQITRNNGQVELGGRSLIWHTFFQFIENHLILGNGSYKLFIPYYDGRMAHGHNSFIMTLATNGVIIFSFYIYLVFRNIDKKNFPYISTLIIVSMAQYIIFWGISLEDIILFYMLKYKITQKGEELVR